MEQIVNLRQFYTVQETLDSEIIKEKGLEGIRLLDRKIMALAVEISELANEWAGFKFWREKKPINLDKMMEEYVDCLHFILTIGIDLKVNRDYEFDIPSEKYDKDLVWKFLDLYSLVLSLLNQSEHYYTLVGSFLDLSWLLGFEWEEVQKKYLEKNMINWDRIRHDPYLKMNAVTHEHPMGGSE